MKHMTNACGKDKVAHHISYKVVVRGCRLLVGRRWIWKMFS